MRPRIVSLLLYSIHDDSVKNWVNAQSPKLKHSHGSTILENKPRSDKIALLHSEWSIALKYEITSIKVTSNEFLTVKHDPLRRKILINDIYWAY